MIPLGRCTMLTVLLSLAAAAPGVAGAPEVTAPARIDTDSNPLPAGAVARLGTSQTRHGGVARGVTFSPDGKTLASWGDDGRIILRDVTTGKEIRRFTLPQPELRTVLFSADGRQLYANARSGDGMIRVLDADTGKEVRQFRVGSRFVTTFALSPDGRLLVVAGDADRLIRVLETATGKEVRRFGQGQKGVVTCVAFSADGKFLATACPAETPCLWDIDTGKEVRRFVPTAPGKALAARYHTLAFSPDGKTLATGGPECPVVLWDVATGKELRQFPASIRARALAFSPNGRFLAVGAGNRSLYLNGVASGMVVRHWEAHGDVVHAVAFSPDGRLLASAGQDSAARLWDVEQNHECHSGNGHRGEILALAFSPDGSRLATSSADLSIRVWDAATRRQIDRLSDSSDLVSSLAFAGDGRTVFISGPKVLLDRWRPDTGRERVALQGLPANPRMTVLSPDGKTLAWVSMDWQVIRLYSTATGKEERVLPVRQLQLNQLVFAPDGKSLAFDRLGSALRLWDPTASPELRGIEESLPGTPSGRLGQVIAWSPDGRSLATAGAELRVWEVMTGRERGRFPLDSSRSPDSALPARGRRSAAFSADGRVLFAGEPDGSLRLLDMATGKEAARILAHRGPVRVTVLSPDGRTLATGGNDGTVLLWDTAALVKDLPRLEAVLSAKDLDRLWVQLGSENDPSVSRAVWALAGAPTHAVPFLKQRLQHLADPAHVARLIAQLDADAFTLREQASRDLAALGPEVRPALQKALERPVSAEMKRRIEELLDKKLKEEGVPATRVRCLRAVEVLECAGTPEARQFLDALAKGSSETWLAETARLALQRLDRRSADTRR